MDRPDWQPILEGQDAEKAQRIVAQVVHDRDPADSMARLDSFAVLLDAYLAKVHSSDERADATFARLERVIEQASRLRSSALYGGLAGVAWVTAHVNTLLSEWLDTASGEASEAWPDALFIREVRSLPEPVQYDLISGLVGLAVYAIEHLPAKEAEQLLGGVIDRLLARKAVRMPHGSTFLTEPELLPAHQRIHAPSGNYNLGVAHGIPAVVVVLAHGIRRGYRVIEARELVDALWDWMVAQQCSSGPGARFPTHVEIDGRSSGPAREAWCYGGLGLSVALLRAAQLLDDTSKAHAAVEFAKLEAERSIESSDSKDCGLCHGAAGNAHLFNRLFQASGDEIFLDAAHRWFNVVLSEHGVRPGVGGYQFWAPGVRGGGWPPAGWRSDATFLVGSSGVALALLGATSSVEPNWDRLLVSDLKRGTSFPPLI
ncbi:MAG: lanthionine synthetase C family protein [Myxococcaceae bacterium]